METKGIQCFDCALFPAVKLLNSSLDSAEVARSLTKVAAEAIGAKACSLLLLTPDRRELYHAASFGLSESYLEKGHLQVDEAIARALAGQPVLILHAGNDPRVQYREHAVREGIASILTVPMLLRDEPIGALRLYTAEPHEFAEDEITFAGVIADLGAIAIDNARRYENIRRSNADLERYLLEWYAMCR